MPEPEKKPSTLELLKELAGTIERLVQRNEWLEHVAGEMLATWAFAIERKHLLGVTPEAQANFEMYVKRWTNALKEDQPK